MHKHAKTCVSDERLLGFVKLQKESNSATLRHQQNTMNVDEIGRKVSGVLMPPPLLLQAQNSWGMPQPTRIPAGHARAPNSIVQWGEVARFRDNAMLRRRFLIAHERRSYCTQTRQAATFYSFHSFEPLKPALSECSAFLCQFSAAGSSLLYVPREATSKSVSVFILLLCVTEPEPEVNSPPTEANEKENKPP